MSDLTDSIAALESRVVVDDDCVKHLNTLMNIVWGEACYDAYSDATRAFAERLMPHLTALNKKWKFRR